jgi:hypothetical protein
MATVTEAEIVEHGVWCDTCLLPSAVIAAFHLAVYAKRDDDTTYPLPSVQVQMKVCADCESTSVVKQD